MGTYNWGICTCPCSLQDYTHGPTICMILTIFSGHSAAVQVFLYRSLLKVVLTLNKLTYLINGEIESETCPAFINEVSAENKLFETYQKWHFLGGRVPAHRLHESKFKVLLPQISRWMNVLCYMASVPALALGSFVPPQVLCCKQWSTKHFQTFPTVRAAVMSQ